MRGRRRAILALASVILLASLALNVALGIAAFRLYRETQALRLDPADAARFARANAELARSKGTRPLIVFVGDSRIAMWADPPVPPGCRGVNRGIGYQTTAQVLLRLEEDVLRLRPAVAVIQVGINDLKTLGLFPGRERAITEGCRDNLMASIVRMEQRGIRVVALTIFPVGRPEAARRPIWSDATIDAADEVNRSLFVMAGPGYYVVDCDRVLRAGRRIDPAYAADLLHLNDAGYRALGAAVGPVLAGIVADIQRAGPSHAVQ